MKPGVRLFYQSAEVLINGINKIGSSAKLTILQSDDLEAENSLDSLSVVASIEMMIKTKARAIALELKANSLSVIRVKF